MIFLLKFSQLILYGNVYIGQFPRILYTSNGRLIKKIIYSAVNLTSDNLENKYYPTQYSLNVSQVSDVIQSDKNRYVIITIIIMIMIIIIIIIIIMIITIMTMMVMAMMMSCKTSDFIF